MVATASAAQKPAYRPRRYEEFLAFCSMLCSKLVSDRITIEAGKRSGQPCIRALRITVWDVLGWLAAGMSEAEILDDYPELERDDFRAIYDYAARVGKRVAL